ncbi:hypothetical protein ACFLXE_04075 [Chloroflexota bacterium]
MEYSALKTKQVRNRMGSLLRGQKGASLMETTVALAILGVIGVGFLQALFTISDGTDTHQGRAVAASLAQSQVEYVKSTQYLSDGSYDVIVDLPPGYTVCTEAEVKEVGKQEIKVTVYHQDNFVLEVTSLKVDW